MTNLKSILCHSSSVVSRKVGNEFVLVPVTNNIADMNSVYVLNETGAFIWELVDGKKSVEQIIGIVTDEFDINKQTAENDVFTFINNLNKYLIIT